MQFNFVVDLYVVPSVFNSALFRRIIATLFSYYFHLPLANINGLA